MNNQQARELLLISENRLLRKDGDLVATVPLALGPTKVFAYTHLFATAPQLLSYLEEKLSSTLKIAKEQLEPRPTLTGYRGYFGGHSFPDIPSWVEEVMQVLATAYGENSTLGDEDTELSISKTEANCLEDEEGNLVVRLSEKNKESSTFRGLFLAAPGLLEKAEAMAKEGMEEIDREYESGKTFDPLGANESRFIVPDQLRYLCDLVAKARGASPLNKITT